VEKRKKKTSRRGRTLRERKEDPLEGGRVMRRVKLGKTSCYLGLGKGGEIMGKKERLSQRGEKGENEKRQLSSNLLGGRDRSPF